MGMEFVTGGELFFHLAANAIFPEGSARFYGAPLHPLLLHPLLLVAENACLWLRMLAWG